LIEVNQLTTIGTVKKELDKYWKEVLHRHSPDVIAKGGLNGQNYEVGELYRGVTSRANRACEQGAAVFACIGQIPDEAEEQQLLDRLFEQ